MWEGKILGRAQGRESGRVGDAERQQLYLPLLCKNQRTKQRIQSNSALAVVCMLVDKWSELSSQYTGRG